VKIVRIACSPRRVRGIQKKKGPLTRAPFWFFISTMNVLAGLS